MRRKKTLEEFKIEMNLKFGKDYSVLANEYINNKTPILVRHNICNSEFYVRPDLLLNNYKTGCPNCSKVKLKDHNTFISEVKKIFGDEYTILGKYINADTLISIRHNKCRKRKISSPT